jgi:hypothetical protein
MKKLRWSVLVLTLLASRASSQDVTPRYFGQPAPMYAPPQTSTFDPSFFNAEFTAGRQNDPLAGNHNFPNFIGWMSNPIQSVDPRAVTALYPVFGAFWTSADPPIPSARLLAGGPAITVALGERFSFGLNDGALVNVDLSRNDQGRLAALDPQGRFRNIEAGGSHTGFANLGGFFQYTVIEDVPKQFLLTAGIQWNAPSGSTDIFQGHGPVELTGYLTAGKEFGCYHILATTGYEFPAGPGNDITRIVYANVHFDRQTFGWLYPLVEFNASAHTSSFSVGLNTRRGFFDLGNFETSGDIVTVAVGANAVLIREHVELGAVYSTSLSAEHGFDINGLIVKMMLRY